MPELVNLVQNLAIHQGAIWQYSFTAPINLDAYTVRAILRKNYEFTEGIEFGVQAIGAQVYLSLTATQTASLLPGTYVWDVFAESASYLKLQYGRAVVIAAVSEEPIGTPTNSISAAALIAAHNADPNAHANGIAGNIIASFTDLSSDVVLIIGQSNGAGAGNPRRLAANELYYNLQYTTNNDPNAAPLNDPNFDFTDYRLQQYCVANSAYKDQVITARDPLQHPSIGVRVGFGMTFCRALLQQTPASRRVLIVPAAVGGTSFSANQWNPGDSLAVQAVNAANKAIALNSGNKIRCILFALGEGDVSAGMPAATYQAKQDALFAYLRASISGAADCPIVIVGMSPNWYESYQLGLEINAVHRDTPHRVPRTWFVEPPRDLHNALDLATQIAAPQEHIHFNAQGQRAIGEQLYLALAKASKNAAGVPMPTLTISVAAVTSNTVTLNLSIPPNSIAYSFEILYRVKGDIAWQAKTCYTSPYKLQGLSGSTDYEFKARSRSLSEYSADSAIAVATTQASIAISAAYLRITPNNPATITRDVNGFISAAADVTGNGRNLAQPNPTFQPSYINEAGLNLIATSTIHTLVNPIGFPANSSYTVMAIVRLLNQAGNGVIVGGNTVDGHLWWRSGTTTELAAGNTGNPPTPNWRAVVAPAPLIHNWYCLFLVHDINSKAISVYSNATLKASGIENVINADTMFALNSFQDANAGGMGSNARYLEAAVWDAALSPAQIQQETDRLSALYGLKFVF